MLSVHHYEDVLLNFGIERFEGVPTDLNSPLIKSFSSTILSGKFPRWEQADNNNLSPHITSLS